MIRQCFLANTGIMFHKDTFFKIGLDPATIFPKVLPRPPMILQDPKVHAIPVPKPLIVCDDRKAVVYTDGGSFINEAEEDLADALSPMYDQLKLAKYWWILEMIPQRIHYQSSDTDKMVNELTYVDFSISFRCVVIDNSFVVLCPLPYQSEYGSSSSCGHANEAWRQGPQKCQNPNGSRWNRWREGEIFTQGEHQSRAYVGRLVNSSIGLYALY